MNPLPGNPHSNIASRRLAETPIPRGIGGEAQVNFGFDALTQATLALAYEQRTQSMILMLNDAVKWANEYPGRVTEEHNRYMQKKREELHARLGMDGVTS